MVRNGKLYITLKSNLCPGSGYAYAGLIDSDVCFDDLGLPYIPARRIKGCLKQSAEDYLLETIVSGEDIEKIFGVSGDNAQRGLVIGNANVIGSEKVRADLVSLGDSMLVNPEKILNCYTSVLGQTKLEDGIASDNSLRYTRVINHFSPVDGNELEFVAPVSIQYEDESILEKIEKIAKVTRNIGLKRNRGLGSVRCKVVFEDTSQNNYELGEGEEDVVLEFTVRNESPIIVSSTSDNESIKYIPGQTMLGFMAGMYLKTKNISSSEASFDSVFQELFVTGQTKFLNLYPSKGGKIYYPAPTYINKLKKTKKLVNVLDDGNSNSNTDSQYNVENGNLPKKIKGGFVNFLEDMSVDVLEVDTSMVYHHRGRTKDDQDGLLYCMEVIDPNQEFTGKILLKNKYVPLVSGILENCHISLGKSRSAQYGSCKLINWETIDNQASKEHTGNIVVTLLSDSIFMNSKGEYSVYMDEVYHLIAEELGISVSDISMEEIRKSSMISTKMVVGYQATWNLRKMPVPAIAAGSSFIFKLDGTKNIDSSFVGCKNHEGYGLIRIDSLNDMEYVVKEQLTENKENVADITICDETKAILREILVDSVWNRLKMEGINNNILAKISPSALGRMTLMLKESLSEYGEDVSKAKEDFRERINSIKTESAKKEGEKIFKIVNKISYTGTDEEDRLAKAIGYKNGISDMSSELDRYWGKYAMMLLTLQKYEMASKGAK